MSTDFGVVSSNFGKREHFRHAGELLLLFYRIFVKFLSIFPSRICVAFWPHLLFQTQELKNINSSRSCGNCGKLRFLSFPSACGKVGKPPFVFPLFHQARQFPQLCSPFAIAHSSKNPDALNCGSEYQSIPDGPVLPITVSIALWRPATPIAQAQLRPQHRAYSRFFFPRDCLDSRVLFNRQVNRHFFQV